MGQSSHASRRPSPLYLAVLAWVTLAGCRSPERGSWRTGPDTDVPAEGSAALSVSLVAPEVGDANWPKGDRCLPGLPHPKTDRHFHVVLRNQSSESVRVWEDRNSWGYSALSFEAVDDLGRKYSIRKRPRHWTRNQPTFLVLEPGGLAVLNVSFDESIWEGLPRPSGEDRDRMVARRVERGEGRGGWSIALRLRAVYSSGDYDGSLFLPSGDPAVWRGHAASEWSRVLFEPTP